MCVEMYIYLVYCRVNICIKWGGCFLNIYICINLIELTSRANNQWF